MHFEASLPLSKEFVLERLTEEEIFEQYLGVEVQTQRKFRNPLRQDKHPTCTFSYRGGRLRFRDWAWNRPMDCFDLVAYIYNTNYEGALEQIAADFNLADKKPRKKAINQMALREEHNKKASQSGPYTEILVHISDWKEQERSYLRAHGISGEQVQKFNCLPIDKVWVNGKDIWYYSEEDPAIGYYFGTAENGLQRWKIYFYKRDERRFLCNTSLVQGWPQLPDSGDLCVITKSLKDVMALHSFGITAVAPQAESVAPPDDKMKELKDRFTHVVSLYDFDYAGVCTANQMRKEHNIPALFLTDGRFDTLDFGAKDFSDYVRDFGRQATWGLIEEAQRRLTEPAIS
jgi:hypothetical protein